MKSSWSFIVIALLCALFVLELLQLRQFSLLRLSEKEDFLPMVYENQIYQASLIDGLDIISSDFHTSLIKRNVIDQPVLVFRYSGLSCKGCVQSCVNLLQRLFPDFEDNNRILIVVSEAASNKLPQNSLILDFGEELGYDYEGTHVPHFFVYDGQIKHTFIPDQTDQNALSLYLSTIKGRYRI